MRRGIFSLFMLLTLSQLASAQSNGQSIQDMDFLIGTWDVLETIYPGTDRAFQEKGTRVCEYYLKDTMIKCESRTNLSTSGRERVYVYLIKYNSRAENFTAINFAHDFPLHGYFRWNLDMESEEIVFNSPRSVNDDQFVRGTISFENRDRLVWRGWGSKFDGDREWYQIFEDVATRRQ